jgi:predicted aspartyl protease
VVAKSNLTDPYEILKLSFDANGGLNRLKAERTQYMEGTLAVAGLKGTLKAWSQQPDRSRAEVDLGVLKMTQGDNGQYQWVVDSNGKLQKITKPDEPTIKRRQLKKLMADYEYANPKSDVFKVTMTGVEKVQDKDCYVIKIANNINGDVITNYINVETFLLEKSEATEGDERKETFTGDYRKISGLQVPFWSKEISLNSGQIQEVTLTKYESNPQVDTSLFEPPERTGKDYRFSSGSSAENIPFRYIGNHIFVFVKVGCKERLWVLDTGAGMSCISEAFAKELGLKLEGDLKGLGAGGTQVSLRLATLPPFELPGIVFDSQTVAVLDMKALNQTIGFDCAGILGFDFLSRFVTKVDYANLLLCLYDPETFKYLGDGHEVNMHVKEAVFRVEATLDSVHSGSWLFDMGASGTSLNAAYAARNGFAARKIVEGLGRGAGSAFKTGSVKCRSFEFAGYKIDSPIVSFSAGAADTAIKSDEIGALGNTLFRNFVIYCDYAHEKLIVEKGDKFNQPFPIDNSGVQFKGCAPEEPVVIFVSPVTPAAKADFQEGDVVKSINGIPVRYFDGLTAVREMLQQEPGTKFSFVVERNGQKKELKLTLANLYE